MNPFIVGLACGLAVAVIAIASMMYRTSDAKKKAKEEVEKYRKLLADKMEVEADGIRRLKEENEKLKEQNKNLEVSLRVMSEKSDKKDLLRLQVMQRAAERLTVEAPGFAQAWQEALQRSEEESERVFSGLAPFFRKLPHFRGGQKLVDDGGEE